MDIAEKALAVSAMTDFLLAAEAFFLSGRLFGETGTRGSAAWFWAAALFFLGLAALLGGIDHGFLEPAARVATPAIQAGRATITARLAAQRLTWLAIGLLTFCTVLTLGRQFFPARSLPIFMAAGLLQFLLFGTLVVLRGRFILVGLNYAPVLLLFLALNILGLGRGNGSWPMTVGLLVSLLASGVQASGFDRLRPIDHNGLYHLLLMVAAGFLFIGGRDLR
jgi:hypothetical protein